MKCRYTADNVVNKMEIFFLCVCAVLLLTLHKTMKNGINDQQFILVNLGGREVSDRIQILAGALVFF